MFQGAFCLVKLHCGGERREDGRSIIGLLKEDALICAVSADIAEGVYGLFGSGEGDAGGIGVGMKDRVGSLAPFRLPFRLATVEHRTKMGENHRVSDRPEISYHHVHPGPP